MIKVTRLLGIISAVAAPWLGVAHGHEYFFAATANAMVFLGVGVFLALQEAE